jgi:hypothetical protein
MSRDCSSKIIRPRPDLLLDAWQQTPDAKWKSFGEQVRYILTPYPIEGIINRHSPNKSYFRDLRQARFDSFGAR